VEALWVILEASLIFQAHDSSSCSLFSSVYAYQKLRIFPHDHSRRIHQFGFGPVVFAIGNAVSAIPGIREALDYSVRRR
jgi:hypothetical protein